MEDRNVPWGQQRVVLVTWGQGSFRKPALRVEERLLLLPRHTGCWITGCWVFPLASGFWNWNMWLLKLILFWKVSESPRSPGPSLWKALVMLRLRPLTVWSVLSLSRALDLLGQHGCFCVYCSAPVLETRLSFALSKQGHCFIEENYSMYMLSNTKGIYIFAISL